MNRCLNGWSDKEEGRDHICAAAPPPILSICTGPSCYISPPLAIFILLSASYPTPPPTSHRYLSYFLPSTHPLPITPPPHTPASSVSLASVINLFSSHLTTVKWFISNQFAAGGPSPADHSRDSARPCYLFSLFCFSEVANYLNAHFNLVPALWMLLIFFFF